MGSKINPNKYIGNKYGRLTIMSIDNTQPRIINGKKYGYRHYLNCLCECGNKKSISHLNILSGHTESCGCMLKEIVAKRSFKHGHTVGKRITSEWASWSSMISRCYVKTSSAWNRYGAIGITVCDEWRNKDGFINFLTDMGNKPNKTYTIDRIDGTKNYCKDNCRWASKSMQSNNQKSNRKIEWDGDLYNVSQIMHKLGIYTSSGVYYTRLDRGWSTHRTFTTPIKNQ